MTIIWCMVPEISSMIDIKRYQTQFFVILGYFLPFYPLTQKIKFLKKWKKLLGILSFYPWVPQIKIICMVPEISSTTDIIFCHLGPVFLTKNCDHRLYCSWDIVRDGCNCYFSFWATSCPFTSLIAQKIKNIRKMKKTPGDIFILHKCTKTHDHRLYHSWDMAGDECNFCFSFWATFALLPL